MDVVLLSNSNPFEIKAIVDSVIKNIKTKQPLEFLLHENLDPAKKKESVLLLKWAINEPHFVTVLKTFDSDCGCLLTRLKDYIKSKYFLFIGNSLGFIKEVDMDPIIKLMNDHEHINQVSFNPFSNPESIKKPGGPKGENRFYYKPFLHDKNIFLINERWSWYPSIWRRSFFIHRWRYFGHDANQQFNRQLKHGFGYKEWDSKFLEKNLGALIYGNVSDGPFLEEIIYEES
ncbi:MAG: hypothetical protein ACOC56_00135 [Atribacterota bacterium]